MGRVGVRHRRMCPVPPVAPQVGCRGHFPCAQVARGQEAVKQTWQHLAVTRLKKVWKEVTGSTKCVSLVPHVMPWVGCRGHLPCTQVARGQKLCSSCRCNRQ